MITYQEHTTHINQPSTHIIICLISHILTYDFWGKNSNTAILHRNFQLNKIVISRSRLFDGNAFCIRHYLNLKLLAYTLFLNDLLAGLFLHFQIILYPNCMSRMKFQIWFKIFIYNFCNSKKSTANLIYKKYLKRNRVWVEIVFNVCFGDSHFSFLYLPIITFSSF